MVTVNREAFSGYNRDACLHDAHYGLQRVRPSVPWLAGWIFLSARADISLCCLRMRALISSLATKFLLVLTLSSA